MINPQQLTWVTRALPNFLWPLKRIILKNTLKRAGHNFRFSPDSIFIDHRVIEIGNNVFFGKGTCIFSSVSVKIGNGIMFGPDVLIVGGDHNFNVVGKLMNQVKEGGLNLPISFENDVWVGSRAIILKGVKIGEGAVIGAGSVVTKSLPPYSICMGNPCKPLKCRFSNNELKEHLAIINSGYTLEEIEVQFRQWNIKTE